jgi:transforming growth factor-beta-induced protein
MTMMIHIKTVRRVAQAAFLLSAITACNSNDGGSAMPGDQGMMPGPTGGGSMAPADIVDTAVAAGDFKTLAAALTKADLVTTLKGKGPFTVFAPNDAAFAKLPAGTLDSLSMAELVKILTYHVVDGKVSSADLKAGKVPTLAGIDVQVDLSAGVKINDATVIKADIEASNGIIHVVDTVLLPKSDMPAASKNIVENAVAAGKFNTLAKALTDTGLIDTLSGQGPFTVFAPTDDAFAALPKGTLESLSKDELKQILLYHVVAGDVRAKDVKAGPVKTASGISAFLSTEGGVKLNGANVTTADVVSSNGVIHVIDKVILPTNIVEAATLAGGFTSLAGALTRVGLVDTLTGKGPFTVFAPTDAAFAALPKGTVEGLSDADLKNVLLYHVVGGSVLSTDLKAGPVDTLNPGKQVQVGLTGGVTINDSKVVVADIVATNGVIHVIDAVLLPK